MLQLLYHYLIYCLVQQRVYQSRVQHLARPSTDWLVISTDELWRRIQIEIECSWQRNWRRARLLAFVRAKGRHFELCHYANWV